MTRERVVIVDLTGSTMGPDYLSAEVRGDWPTWSDTKLRDGGAEHYGVPVEQVKIEWRDVQQKGGK